jgi:hypothetical protein
MVVLMFLEALEVIMVGVVALELVVVLDLLVVMALAA